MVTASLAELVWLVYALRLLLPRAQVLPRLLPLLAMVALGATAWAFYSASAGLVALGHYSAQSVVLFGGPLAFAGGR